MELFTTTDRLLSHLCAMEQLVGHVAAEALPLDSAMRVQETANDLAQEILVRCGIQLNTPLLEDFDSRHETDELLKMAVVPKVSEISRTHKLSTVSAKAHEPIDIGPEGAADPTLRLPTDESDGLHTDPSEETHASLEDLVAFEKKPEIETLQMTDDGADLITFEEIEPLEDFDSDEQKPIPLVPPTDSETQYVIDDSEDEPLEELEYGTGVSDETEEPADEDEPLEKLAAHDEDEPLETLEAHDEDEPLETLEAHDEDEPAEPDPKVNVDAIPALEVEDDEPDTERPGRRAVKGRGASVKLNTIKVSKRTAAPRTRASVRVATADTPEEALAMGDSHDFAMPEMIATLSSDEHDTENGSKEVDPQIVEITENAKAALNEGALEDAVDYYSDIIDIDGEHYEAFLRRGRVHLDLGDYGRAMSDFTVADDLQPDNPHTRVALGDLLFARKEYSRSIEFYNAALVELPEHAMAICRRGIGYYYKRQFPEALRDLEQAYKLDRSIPNIATYVIMAKKKVKNLAQ